MVYPKTAQYSTRYTVSFVYTGRMTVRNISVSTLVLNEIYHINFHARVHDDLSVSIRLASPYECGSACVLVHPQSNQTGVVNKPKIKIYIFYTLYIYMLVQLDTTYVSRRGLDRFGCMIASIIALHHTKPAVTASYRSGVRVANVPRCRKNIYLVYILQHRCRK